MLLGQLKPLPALFSEEERSKQPSAFSILRALIEEFRGAEDSRLALVGAFGYDLLFQFEPIEKRLPRDGHKDLHLFLCDDIYFMDRKKEVDRALSVRFRSARDFPRWRSTAPPRKCPRRAASSPAPSTSDHTPRRVHGQCGDACAKACARGDYYEVVLRQTFRTPYSGKASELVRARAAAPAPARTNFCCSSATSS